MKRIFLNLNKYIYLKMTNQMILACKSYLTVNGTVNIWNESKPLVISRMNDCIALYEQYYNCYKVMLKNIKDSPDEKPLEMSEMYVFGKFDTFKTRLNKVSQ